MASTSYDTPFSLLRHPEFATMALIQFAMGMSFATIIIALALYADLFNASGWMAGLWGAAYALTRLFLVIPVGRYSDVGNAKRFLIVGMGLQIIVLGGFILVQVTEHVLLLRFLQGIGSIVVYIVGTSIIGSIAADGKRGLWIGTYQQVGAFASLSGDIVGGAMLFLFGFEITYLVLIAVSIVATIFAAIYLRPTPVGGRQSAAGSLDTLIQLVKRRAIIALISFRFSFSFGKMAVILFLPIYARAEFGMNPLLIGGILAGGKLAKSLAQGYVGILADRIGHEDKFILVGIVGYAFGTMLIPFAPFASRILDPIAISAGGTSVALLPAFFWLFGCYLILGLADSLRIPTSVSLFVEEGEHFDAVGSSLSLRSVSWQVGAVIGPAAVGGMIDILSYLAAFWMAAFFMLGAGVVFLALYRSEPPPPNSALSEN